MNKFIFDSVKSVSKDISFSTPGHKGREFNYLKFNYDVTELDETDNLLEPSGAILKSMEELKKIYGSKKSYYLTQGSSLGIMSATMVGTERSKAAMRSKT